MYSFALLNFDAGAESKEQVDWSRTDLTKRIFLALVEMESKKKKRAAKASNEFMTKFNQNVADEHQALKRHLEELKVET
jgi:hypothetical protein